MEDDKNYFLNQLIKIHENQGKKRTRGMKNMRNNLSSKPELTEFLVECVEQYVELAKDHGVEFFDRIFTLLKETKHWNVSLVKRTYNVALRILSMGMEHKRESLEALTFHLVEHPDFSVHLQELHRELVKEATEIAKCERRALHVEKQQEALRRGAASTSAKKAKPKEEKSGNKETKNQNQQSNISAQPDEAVVNSQLLASPASVLNEQLQQSTSTIEIEQEALKESLILSPVPDPNQSAGKQSQGENADEKMQPSTIEIEEEALEESFTLPPVPDPNHLAGNSSQSQGENADESKNTSSLGKSECSGCNKLTWRVRKRNDDITKINKRLDRMDKTITKLNNRITDLEKLVSPLLLRNVIEHNLKIKKEVENDPDRKDLDRYGGKTNVLNLYDALSSVVHNSYPNGAHLTLDHSTFSEHEESIKLICKNTHFGIRDYKLE